MIRARQIRFMGTFEDLGSALNVVREPGDVSIVLRGRLRWFVINCPDGCGDCVPVNLDGRAGPAWWLRNENAEITLYPSIWRDTGCESHFVIWRNRIWWGFDWEEDAVSDGSKRDVLNYLSRANEPQDALTIGEAVDIEPWTAWAVCNQLADEGRITKIGRVGRYKFFRR